MVSVRLLVSRAGPDLAQSAGDVVAVSAEEAERMVAAGQCEIVRTATPEKAIARRRAEKAVK
jgi:hypothetical protein